ncbi:hypothetical protein SUDANB21_04417 [Streptomyces sp. enrichment culture]
MYDGFDHVVKSQKTDENGTLKSTSYVFDPLDRTVSKTTDGKTTDFEYLGLSSEVLDEKVAGELTKSYQYSPWGERLSQITHNSDGTTEDGYYGYNNHTDVETLTDKNGDTKATYGYTAYGKDDESEFTGIDKPETADPAEEAYNPYRFNSKRWDAQSGTYDMGFRDYSPGLNRFTSRDMYNGALADMGLGADPYTGNRYAFGGGNPTSFIELDGHMLAPLDSGGGGGEEEDPWYKELSARHDTAVVMATDYLKSQFPNDDFGNEVKIPGGSAKGNGNVGWADIVRWGKDKVEVWEVKQAGGPAEADGPAQLARYIKKLQKMLRDKGDNRKVVAGADIVPELGPTPSMGNPKEKITARSTQGGIITYDVNRDDDDDPEPPSPRPSPSARPTPTPTKKDGGKRPVWTETRPLFQPQAQPMPHATPGGDGEVSWDWNFDGEKAGTTVGFLGVLGFVGRIFSQGPTCVVGGAC